MVYEHNIQATQISFQTHLLTFRAASTHISHSMNVFYVTSLLVWSNQNCLIGGSHPKPWIEWPKKALISGLSLVLLVRGSKQKEHHHFHFPMMRRYQGWEKYQIKMPVSLDSIWSVISAVINGKVQRLLILLLAKRTLTQQHSRINDLEDTYSFICLCSVFL